MNARDLVTTRLAEQARRFPDLTLGPLDVGGLEPRDAALAIAIDQAVARRWLTLVAVIQSRLSRPWAELEPKLQGVMLAGAAQLLLLERLPDHAVINESVEWAKRNVRPKAGGLVNAVLRKVAGLRKELSAKPPVTADLRHETEWATDELPLGDGRVWKLNDEVFDSSPVPRLAQQTSHPDTLLSHWISIFGHDEAARIAYHDLIHPPTIWHGATVALAAATAASCSSDAERPSTVQPHDVPGFFVIARDRESLTQLLRENPGAIVQDPTSAAPARATSDLHPPPAFIVDACAGMGTKTRQLAALHPKATIIATDIAEKRSDVLRQQFAGHDRVQVIEHRQLGEFAGRADLVLLDVPCSNTGVLARRVEAKYRFNRKSLEKLVDLQRQIIADSLPLLKESGRLVYATCSIDPAENQEQARWVCKWHPMRIEHEQTRLPTAVPGDPPAAYSDGGYYAILQRGEKK